MGVIGWVKSYTNGFAEVVGSVGFCDEVINIHSGSQLSLVLVSFTSRQVVSPEISKIVGEQGTLNYLEQIARA